MITVGDVLKSCPFCGHDGVMWSDYRFVSYPEDMWMVYGAMCSNKDCIAHQQQKFYMNEFDARSAWNRRENKNEKDSNVI